MSTDPENMKQAPGPTPKVDLNAIAEEAAREAVADAGHDKPGPEPRKKNVSPAKVVQGVLDGTILTRGQLFQLIPFILYVVFLIMLAIANTYYAEKMVRQIEAVKKELKELRYEQITTRSELMYISKQSEVARRLKVTGLKESTVPPEKILIRNTEEGKEGSAEKQEKTKEN
jgi:hypothetical protein